MTFARGPSALHRVFLALASAALLVIAFPSFNQSWAAWIALVPWLVLLRDVKARAAFRWSWLIGFVFFLASIWWLVHVTLVGWIVLCAYLALYFGVFGWTVAWLSHDVGQGAGGRGQGTSKNPFSRAPRPLPLVPSLIVIPAIWTVLEYLRSHLLSGFGWNLLAYSQTPWLPIIQFARVTGAWGVSFLIVLLNVSVAGVLIGRQSQAGGDKEPPSDVPLLSACCMLLVAVFGYVLWQVQVKPQSEGAEARVAVVQGNIPQEQKWDEAFQERILTQYETLTRAAAMAHPGLIVWPETSAPGYFGIDEDVTQRVLRLQAAVGRPILLGTPYPRVTPDGLLLMNRATMVNGPSGPWKSYDKLHLVPFGEFVPGDRQMPWLRKVLPPIGDFTPGQSYTVFRTPVASGQWRVASGQLKRGQSTVEYAVFIAVVSAALAVMALYVRRSIQANLKMLEQQINAEEVS